MTRHVQLFLPLQELDITLAVTPTEGVPERYVLPVEPRSVWRAIRRRHNWSPCQTPMEGVPERGGGLADMTEPRTLRPAAVQRQPRARIGERLIVREDPPGAAEPGVSSTMVPNGEIHFMTVHLWGMVIYVI